jgi:hypothetical protein
LNLLNAIKLLETNVDYSIDAPEIKDAIEEASLVVQNALDFDTSKVFQELRSGKLKKYKKPAREVNTKMKL